MCAIGILRPAQPPSWVEIVSLPDEAFVAFCDILVCAFVCVDFRGTCFYFYVMLSNAKKLHASHCFEAALGWLFFEGEIPWQRQEVSHGLCAISCSDG